MLDSSKTSVSIRSTFFSILFGSIGQVQSFELAELLHFAKRSHSLQIQYYEEKRKKKRKRKKEEKKGGGILS